MAFNTLVKEPRSYRVGNKSRELNDYDLQSYLLQGVSRTFALTIPQLPKGLDHAVTNAYLLCRIVDTIEDEPHLNLHQKRLFCEYFLKVVEGNEDPRHFSKEIAPLLSNNTLPLEHELILNTDRVIAVTHRLKPPQQEALMRCIRIMAEGMAYFQDNHTGKGLHNQKEMDRYCYYVAGVVGEMLTELFCEYNQQMAEHKEEMMKLGVSFGQGLQMTNILKDMWEDYERGACWLPRDAFDMVNFNLDHLKNGQDRKKFKKALTHLIGLTHSHLRNAFKYTLMIPPNEKGIREFCLWALGMAILTLQKIYHNRNFTKGEQVKISRRSVKMIIFASHLAASNDFMLSALFRWASRGLPVIPIDNFEIGGVHDLNKN